MLVKTSSIWKSKVKDSDLNSVTLLTEDVLVKPNVSLSGVMVIILKC